MAKVKITVVKKVNNKELFGDNPPVEFSADAVCDKVEVGQEFIYEKGTCPAGFCAWAFADIQRDIIHLLFDGEFPWIKEKGVNLSC